MAVLNSWQKVSRVLGTDGGDGANGAFSSSGSYASTANLVNYVNVTTGTAGSTSLTLGSSGNPGNFTAGDLVYIVQSRGTGAGQWEINGIANNNGYSSGGGAITLTNALQYSYTTCAQMYRVLRYTTWTMNSGHTLTLSAWDGTTGGVMVVCARDSISIAGTITGTGQGYKNGAQNAANGNYAGYQGEGYSAAENSRNTAANTCGGGGGGANNSSGGAGGGGGGGAYGANGSNGNGVGYGGGAAGTADLTTGFIFGGGGGGGGNDDAANFPGSAGGKGGGQIILISKDITISGSLPTNGNNGSNYVATYGGCGGGGAGGAVLLYCATATIGTNKITATAGSGGTGGNGGAGGAGGVGRISIHHSSTVSGTSNPSFNDTSETMFLEITPSINNLVLPRRNRYLGSISTP